MNTPPKIRRIDFCLILVYNIEMRNLVQSCFKKSIIEGGILSCLITHFQFLPLLC